MWRALGAGAAALALLAAGCSSRSGNDKGAVTNVEDVGPQIAKLKAEIAAINRTLAQLEAQLAQLEQRVPAPPR